MHCPLRIVKKNTSSSEFVAWKFKLEQRANEFNPEHYYLAAIRAEIRAANVKDSTKIKLEDCLLKFETRQKEGLTDGKKPDPVKLKKAIEASKLSWMTAVGYFNYHPKTRKRRRNVSSNFELARNLTRDRLKRKSPLSRLAAIRDRD